jgi:hypothetical protein
MTTTPFRKLDDSFTAAGQIQPADVTEAAASLMSPFPSTTRACAAIRWMR